MNHAAPLPLFERRDRAGHFINCLCRDISLFNNFLILRSFLRQRCGNCGLWQKKASYCHACGEKLFADCPSCKEHCNPDSLFCPKCGAPLREQAASPQTDEAG